MSVPTPASVKKLVVQKQLLSNEEREQLIEKLEQKVSSAATVNTEVSATTEAERPKKTRKPSRPSTSGPLTHRPFGNLAALLGYDDISNAKDA